MQRYFDWRALMKPGLALAASVFVALFGLIVLGVPLSGMQAISDFNISRDESAPREFEYRIVEKIRPRATGRHILRRCII